MNAELDFQGSAYYLDGRRLTDTELAEWRDDQVDLMMVELRELTKQLLHIDETRPEKQSAVFAIGKQDIISEVASSVLGAGLFLEEFIDRFISKVSNFVTSAYSTGAGGPEFVADWKPLAQRLRRVDEAAHRFEDAIKAGTLTDAQILARAEDFASHATGAFEQSKLLHLRGGFSPPEQPGDKCEGGPRCRCYWEVHEYEDRWEGVWRAKNDRSTCAHCRANAVKWGA